MPTIEREVQSAVAAPEPLIQLRERLVALLDAGFPREEAYALLDRMRLRYRSEGREREEDIVMEAMDLFSGWVRSDLRI